VQSEESDKIRNHIVGFTEQIDNNAKIDKDVFFNWFNQTGNIDCTFVRGAWDFAIHIANPISPYLKKPEEKTVLDLGYGGGRMLGGACQFFSKVIGVDIHSQNELVQKELNARGLNNFHLLQNDGRSIPVETDSVDMVYSFIVFQHIEKIEIFKNYLNEIFRILRPSGLGCIY